MRNGTDPAARGASVVPIGPCDRLSATADLRKGPVFRGDPSGAGIAPPGCSVPEQSVGGTDGRNVPTVRWLVASPAQQLLDLLSVQRRPGRLEAITTQEPIGPRVCSEHDPVAREDATDPAPP